MWTDNTINAKIKEVQIEVFNILNGYENIDSFLSLIIGIKTTDIIDSGKQKHAP